MRGHVTLCYMVVGGNLNSPLNLFISFAKALMEQGFRRILFWRRKGVAFGRAPATFPADENLHLTGVSYREPAEGWRWRSRLWRRLLAFTHSRLSPV